jgi:hypothetical protein
MKPGMRHQLAQLPFEEKIRKVGELIRLRQKIKKNARDESFNGAELSESVLARDWDSAEEDAAWSNL